MIEAPIIQLSTDFIRAKEYFEAIVSSTSDAICTTDVNGRIMYFSPGAEAMFGARAGEVMGRYAYEMYKGGRNEANEIMRRLRRDGNVYNYETVVQGPHGRSVHVSLSAALLRDRSGRVIGTLGISKDITHHVELERRLRELSITDSLTGLYNQRYFAERLNQEIHRARRQKHLLSMIAIDLDGFKGVNDTLGHLAGDRVLKEFSAVIQRGIRSQVDSAFRYGGDEFVLLLPGIAAPKAKQAAARLLKEAKRALAEYAVSFSYGVASMPRSGSPEEFMRMADERMYAMKKLRS